MVTNLLASIDLANHLSYKMSIAVMGYIARPLVVFIFAHAESEQELIIAF